jgi:hypothetical protein
MKMSVYWDATPCSFADVSDVLIASIVSWGA